MSIEACLTRISEIRAALSPPAPPTSTTATTAAPATSFASALQQSAGVSATGAPAAAPGVSGGGDAGAVEAAAGQLDGMHLPYSYGGGHGTPSVASPSGIDCSASVSWVLQHAGFKVPTMDSSQLMTWGDAGPGREVTIFANASHTFMKIGNRYFGTSGFGHPGAGTGPAWFTRAPSASYLAGFVQRHPPGL